MNRTDGRMLYVQMCDELKQGNTKLGFEVSSDIARMVS